MNDPKGPGAGNIVAGIFLLLFGLCIALVGGGCTILFIGSFSSMGSSPYEATPLFLISLVTLGAGVSLIWLGVKLMSGGFNR
jgi:hypothetical protein